MNNLKNQTNPIEAQNLSDTFFTFETKLKNNSVEKLQQKHLKLSFLCEHFNPYDTQELSVEVENILNEFELMKFIHNPFDFTNIVLRMLDQLDNQIKSKKN